MLDINLIVSGFSFGGLVAQEITSSGSSPVYVFSPNSNFFRCS